MTHLLTSRLPYDIIKRDDSAIGDIKLETDVRLQLADALEEMGRVKREAVEVDHEATGIHPNA